MLIIILGVLRLKVLSSRTINRKPRRGRKTDGRTGGRTTVTGRTILDGVIPSGKMCVPYLKNVSTKTSRQLLTEYSKTRKGHGNSGARKLCH